MALTAQTKFEIGDTVWNEGDKVTKTDLKEAGQTDEQIEELISRGVIGEESKDE